MCDVVKRKQYQSETTTQGVADPPPGPGSYTHLHQTSPQRHGYTVPERLDIYRHPFSENGRMGLEIKTRDAGL